MVEVIDAELREFWRGQGAGSRLRDGSREGARPRQRTALDPKEDFVRMLRLSGLDS